MSHADEAISVPPISIKHGVPQKNRDFHEPLAVARVHGKLSSLRIPLLAMTVFKY